VLKRLTIAIIVIAVTLSGIAIAQMVDNNQIARALEKDEMRIQARKEWWDSSNMKFRYHAMELKLKYYDEYYEKSEDLIKELQEDLIVQTWAKLDAREEIRKLTFFIKTIEAIAEANNMILPKYVSE